MRLNISKLSEGIHKQSLEAQPDEIGLDARFGEPVRVSATLEKTSRQLFLHVEIVTAGLFSCDRCLDEFRREVRNSYTIVYVSDPQAAEGLDEQEVQVIHADTNMIDLGEDVRQYTLLALPLKILCLEECAGLCPECGMNRNRGTCRCATVTTDPRWEGLKRFLGN
ncbi:MAG TPA: DUF177 domain-containing protein [Bacteroidota bacterium]|nr:DUF177 domain-containing protein [Bacteroidota bacterium]